MSEDEDVDIANLEIEEDGLLLHLENPISHKHIRFTKASIHLSLPGYNPVEIENPDNIKEIRKYYNKASKVVEKDDVSDDEENDEDGGDDEDASSIPSKAVKPKAKLTRKPQAPGKGDKTGWYDQWKKDSKELQGWWAAHTRDMLEAQDHFAYDGFKVEELLNEFKKKSSGRDWKTELAHMIILCVERGANIKNLTSKTSKEGTKIIKELIDTYSLKSKPVTRTTLTLPRICLLFPIHTCLYMPLSKNSPVPPSVLVDKYPPAMRVQAFSNLIPKVKITVWDSLVEAHAYYQVLFGEAISKAGSTKSRKDRAREALVFCEMGRQSPLYSDEDRTKFLVSATIYNATKSSLTSAVKEASVIFKGWLND